jgi:hypothetical protein
VAARSGNTPESTSANLGFRCVSDQGTTPDSRGLHAVASGNG